MSSLDSLIRWLSGLGVDFFLIALFFVVYPGSGSLSVASRWNSVSLLRERLSVIVGIFLDCCFDSVRRALLLNLDCSKDLEKR